MMVPFFFFFLWGLFNLIILVVEKPVSVVPLMATRWGDCAAASNKASNEKMCSFSQAADTKLTGGAVMVKI